MFKTLHNLRNDLEHSLDKAHLYKNDLEYSLDKAQVLHVPLGLKSTTCAYHRNDLEYSLDKAQLYKNSFFDKKKSHSLVPNFQTL